MKNPLLFPVLLVAFGLFSFPSPSFARGGHHSSSSHVRISAGTTRPYSSRSHHLSIYAQGVKRSRSGRIARSTKVKDEFKHSHPCPSTGRSTGACPGYVIDHVVPLKRGGADSVENMQWQTKEEARAKDKWE